MEALARAYSSNPDLMAQRASARAVSRNVPIAAAGYKPTIRGFAEIGLRYDDPSPGLSGSRALPRGYGLTLNQSLWDGGRTSGGVAQASAQTEGAADLLRAREQYVLAAAAEAYMTVLRNTAALRLRRDQVATLEFLLTHTERRAAIGEVTQADPAQVRTTLAQNRSDVLAAEVEYDSSVARYEVVIGKVPSRLQPGRPLDRLLPKTAADAVATAMNMHPGVRAAAQNVRAAQAAVQIAEAQLSPTVNLSGAVGQRFDSQDYAGGRGMTGLVLATLTVPIYEGGAPTASIARSREYLSEATYLASAERERVRGEAMAAWAFWSRAESNLGLIRRQLSSAEAALGYVRQEADLGTRTTQDVINGQQALLAARISLLNAQRDRVMASYTLLRASGILDADRIGIVARPHVGARLGK